MKGKGIVIINYKLFSLFIFILSIFHANTLAAKPLEAKLKLSRGNMIIRDAKKEDAPELIKLLAQLDPKFKMNLLAMENRIAAFDSKGHQISVAENEGLIIGVIAFGCYEQFRLNGSCCHIDALIVNEEYRGQGVGKQLIALAEKYATEYGAVTIELITANHRRDSGTHAFYEAIGYRDQVVLDYSYFAKERINRQTPFFNKARVFSK